MTKTSSSSEHQPKLAHGRETEIAQELAQRIADSHNAGKDAVILSDFDGTLAALPNGSNRPKPDPSAKMALYHFSQWTRRDNKARTKVAIISGTSVELIQEHFPQNAEYFQVKGDKPERDYLIRIYGCFGGEKRKRDGSHWVHPVLRKAREDIGFFERVVRRLAEDQKLRILPKGEDPKRKHKKITFFLERKVNGVCLLGVQEGEVPEGSDIAAIWNEIVLPDLIKHQQEDGLFRGMRMTEFDNHIEYKVPIPINAADGIELDKGTTALEIIEDRKRGVGLTLAIGDSGPDAPMFHVVKQHGGMTFAILDEEKQKHPEKEAALLADSDWVFDSPEHVGFVLELSCKYLQRDYGYDEFPGFHRPAQDAGRGIEPPGRQIDM